MTAAAQAAPAAKDSWTFTKRQVEQYQFNGPHGMWAIITLDPRGIFQAVSDFGSYSYEGWGHHGCESFKHFLVGLRDADYFLGKVCGSGQGRSGPGRGGQTFAFDATIRELRRRVIERRRDGGFHVRWYKLPPGADPAKTAKDLARQAWDEIEKIDDTSDETYFVERVAQDCPTLFEHVFGNDHCEVADSRCLELAPAPLRFFNEVFRGQLVPALRTELDLDAPAKEPAGVA